MNTAYLIQHWILVVALTGAMLCLGLLALYLCRGLIRRLWDRWLKLNRLGQCAVPLFATVLVLYGGTKPPATTNEPPPMVGLGMTMMGWCPTPEVPAIQTNAAWKMRGAWNDWLRIEFPSGFSFPHSTNMLHGVTVMANGSLRMSLKETEPVATLPQQVSFEPGASSFSYGLSESNTFVFAWSNVCIGRNATNRTDATVELFETGEKIVRFGETETHVPVIPPPGYAGMGQDETWALAALPNEAAIIGEKGYERWLAEDWVGIDEENGRFSANIRVGEMPVGPCYLVCGPYKVIVTEPGTYKFPLQMCETYRVRTYPESLELEIEYDDGFAFDGEPMVLSASHSSSLLMTSAASSPGPQEGYTIDRFPEVFLHPNPVPLDETFQQLVKIRCNAAGIKVRQYTTLWGSVYLRMISHSEIEIVEAEIQSGVLVSVESALGVSTSLLTFVPPLRSIEIGDPQNPSNQVPPLITQ